VAEPGLVWTCSSTSTSPARSKRSSRVPLYGETVFGVKAWDLKQLMDKLQAAGKAGGMMIRVSAVTLEGQEPVRLKSAELSFVCRSDEDVEPDRNLAEFIRSQHVEFTLRRAGFGYSMDFGKKKRKSALVSECAYSLSDGCCSIRLTVGSRFEMEMLRQCFGESMGAVRVSGLKL